MHWSEHADGLSLGRGLDNVAVCQCLKVIDMHRSRRTRHLVIHTHALGTNLALVMRCACLSRILVVHRPQPRLPADIGWQAPTHVPC